MGAKVQPNSGAPAFSKGDIKDSLFLIEAKTMMTKQKSIRIQEEWIDKTKEEAFGEDREHWALAFNFGGDRTTENYYIISEQDFILFKKLLEEYENEYR